MNPVVPVSNPWHGQHGEGIGTSIVTDTVSGHPTIVSLAVLTAPSGQSHGFLVTFFTAFFGVLAMFRSLFVVLVLVALPGCDVVRRNPPQSPPVPVRVWDLSAVTIHRSYLDGSERWTNQKVRVQLNAKEYKVVNEGVAWYADRDTEPPSILFRCTPPPDDLPPMTCTGTVIGRQVDGWRRASGATWTVVVVDCTVEKR